MGTLSSLTRTWLWRRVGLVGPVIRSDMLDVVEDQVGGRGVLGTVAGRISASRMTQLRDALEHGCQAEIGHKVTE
jgi:hypothetical protein